MDLKLAMEELPPRDEPGGSIWELPPGDEPGGSRDGVPIRESAWRQPRSSSTGMKRAPDPPRSLMNTNYGN